MKKKTLSTTEFYRNAAKALGFVKEGGVIYLGYKNLKEPIAVLTTLDDYNSRVPKTQHKKKNKSASKKEVSLYDKYKDRIISAPEYKDSVKFIRKMREIRT